MKNSTLVQRLTAALWLVILMTGISITILTTYLIFRNTEQQARQRIKDEEANIVALGVVDLIALNNYIDLLPLLPATLQSNTLNEIIRIYDRTGHIIYRNVNIADLDPVDKRRFQMVNKGYYIIETGKRDYIAVMRSHLAQDGEVVFFEIATPRTKPLYILQQIALPFSLVFTILLAIAYLIARRVARNMLLPFSDFATQLEDLDVHQLKIWQPIALKRSTREIDTIVSTFNKLLQRMQNTFLHLHQVGQYIAHEVRTPLTVIQGEVESVLEKKRAVADDYREVLRSALDEAAKINAIVGSVLKLSSRPEIGKAFSPSSINLPAFLRGQFASLERLTGLRIVFEEQVSDGVEIFADQELLTLLISNLVRNVAKHGGSTKQVILRLRSEPPSQLFLEILDDGPGLSAALLSAANAEKADQEKLGIGLSLCKQIAALNRIVLQFENRQGGGLCVRIGFSV